MIGKRLFGTGIVAVWSLMLVGCQPSHAEIEAMLKQPPRPAELDRLKAFVGNWKDDVEVKMAGSDETHTGHGQNSTQWAADKWMLVENWEHDMGENDTMKGVSLMWWDARHKKYRATWTDNYGSSGKGTFTYNEETEVWKGEFRERNGETGETTVGEWTAKFPNPSTIEWTWTEWDGWKLIKFLEVSGTSRRQ